MGETRVSVTRMIELKFKVNLKNLNTYIILVI